MTTDQQSADDGPHLLLGAVYEGGAAFILALAIVALYWIREAVRGADAFGGNSFALVGIALAAGMFFGCAAYLRLRRFRRIQSGQGLSPENDAMVARCLASYEDGLDDLTARIPTDAGIAAGVEKVLEERTWNVHRVVVFLRTATESLDMARLKMELARWVSGNLHGNWIRGLGFGIVLRCSGLHAELEHVYQIVDGCGGPTVILQWFVLVDEGRRRGLAVHMPVSGKTTPCCLAMVSSLADDGYSLELAVKEKTGVYRRLCAMDKAVPPWLHVLAPLLH